MRSPIRRQFQEDADEPTPEQQVFSVFPCRCALQVLLAVTAIMTESGRSEHLPKFMQQVLSKMRIKWSTVHAQFSQFNGRPNARGGYDWKFNKEEWVNTLKVLNIGVSETSIAQTFEVLNDGSGWVEFQTVQEVVLSRLFLSPPPQPFRSPSPPPFPSRASLPFPSTCTVYCGD